MDVASLKIAFDASANTYDQVRRQLIPCFDDFYRSVIDLIPYLPEDHFRVLDLGAGTGLLSRCISEKFSNARIMLLDLSEAMLAKAKERFAGATERFEFVVGDYSEQLGGEFDVVVSALSIHHLTNDLKVKLMHRIYNVLSNGGVFINADQVQGSSPEIERLYRERWIQQVRGSGLSDVEWCAALERMKEDKMAPLESQLTWLRQAGFNGVYCWYKNYSFVVYSGLKEC